MNLGQLITKVQDRGYGTDLTQVITDILNDKYEQIWGERRWWWRQKRDTSLSTVVGQPTYSLATITDMGSQDSVRIQNATQHYDLTWMPAQEILTNIHLYRDNGIPAYWSFVDGVLQLFPYPDSVYTIVIDYVYEPPQLVSNTDTPVFPREHHLALVWGAISDLCYRERDVFNGRTADEKWQEQMAAMRKAESLRQAQSSRMVKQSGLYDVYATNRSWFS